MDENYRNIMEDTCIDRENGKSLSQQENSLTEYNAHNGEATDCINDSGEVDKADTLKSTITREMLLEMANQFGIIQTSPDMQLQGFYHVLTRMIKMSDKLLGYEWKFDGTLLAQAYFEYLIEDEMDIKQNLKMQNKERRRVYSYLVQRIKFNSFVLTNRDLISHFHVFYLICLKETAKNISSIPDSNTKDTYYYAEPAERSSEKMSEYLLQFAEVLCPTAIPDKPAGIRLIILYGRLKRMVRLLDALKEFHWLEDFPAVQTATLKYFMAKLISKEEKKQVNKLIVRRMEFCIYMSENREILNWFHTFYKQHLYYIEKYLAAHPVLADENESPKEDSTIPI